MRPFFLIGLATALLAGCSEQKAPVAAPAATADRVQEPAPGGAGDVAVVPPAVSVYPESEEVQALLYRARELRDAGQFQEALALADQALARDPNSPSAAALRGELWAVVTKS
jgi:tetratricopeptide (TPR) repeat protein